MTPVPSPTFDESFLHRWQAEILAAPPRIRPSRQYVYPHAVEEIELGALQILLRSEPNAAPVLATFALGFADPSLPHGLWSCPNPLEICAVAGGYAYLVQTEDPKQWTQVPYRPVVSLHPCIEQDLLLFAGFYSVWALGATGPAWETSRLSWEGLRISGIRDGQLHGYGWDLATDTEVPFTVDLATGKHIGGAAPGSSPSN